MQKPDEDLQYEIDKGLLNGEFSEVLELIEDYDLDVNSITDDELNSTILYSAINPLSEYKGTAEQLAIVEYLIEKGANPNIKTTEGIDCLDVAIERHNMCEITLLLITKANADIHKAGTRGSCPLSVAIREFGRSWREEQKKINKLRFEIIEEMLKRGADLDRTNIHGGKPRDWVTHAEDDKLDALIKKYDDA